jgi:hypothetical protein
MWFLISEAILFYSHMHAISISNISLKVCMESTPKLPFSIRISATICGAPIDYFILQLAFFVFDGFILQGLEL